jgi:LmbE family N-acetylglucosaminyl deacetylase
MIQLSPKSWVRQFLLSRLNASVEECDENTLKKSAIIFAPHQDDETLGCGGTIIKKKKAGANIKIVFLTDGSGSHSEFVTKEEMKALRVTDGLGAAIKLGLSEDDVIFLKFVDGSLSQDRSKAVVKVKEILDRDRPEEIYIPYYQDNHPDHVATNHIAIDALQQSNLSATVYEYPIWFWNHWPWITFSYSRNRIIGFLKNFKAAPQGCSRLLKDFNYVVDIEGVLQLKRSALEQHKTQMSRMQNNPNWIILEDVSDGEFVNCFFQKKELFRRYKVVNTQQ